MVTRERFWTKLLSVMPPALKHEIENRNENDRIHLLLSPLDNVYIKDWANVYCNIAVFVHAVYERRHRIYEDMKQAD